jgi:hypothetical protein
LLGAVLVTLVVYMIVGLATKNVTFVDSGWHTTIYTPEYIRRVITIAILIVGLVVYFIFKAQ